MNLQEIIPFDNRIYTTLISDYTYLIPEIKSLMVKEKSVVKSNRGGWQSPSYGAKDLEFMQPMLEEIKQYIVGIYKHLSIDGCGETNGYWFNVNHKYDYNTLHRHGNCYFSACVYLKTPDNCGNIVFERADFMREHIQFYDDNDRNWGSYWLKPEINRLILFPSFLPHYVEQNRTEDADDERISIAFNFI